MSFVLVSTQDVISAWCVKTCCYLLEAVVVKSVYHTNRSCSVILKITKVEKQIEELKLLYLLVWKQNARSYFAELN